MVPLACCSIVMYDWIVSILLGPQWKPTEWFYLITVIGTVFVCGSWSTGCLFTTQGRTRDMLRLVIIIAVTRIMVVSVSIVWGPYVMAICMITHANLMLIPTIYLAGRSGPVGRWTIGRLCLENGLFLFTCAGLGWAIRWGVSQAQLPLMVNFVIMTILCLSTSCIILLVFAENRNVLKTLIKHIRYRK